MYNQHLCHHSRPYHTEVCFSTDGLTFDSRDDLEYVDATTLETIQDPVVIEGAERMRIYERAGIERWLDTNHTDPFTRQVFSENYALKPVIDLNPGRRYDHYESFNDRIDSFIQFIENKYNHTFIYQDSIDRTTGNRQLTIAIPNLLANMRFSKLIVTFDGRRNLYIAKHMNWSKTYPGNRIPYWEDTNDFWSNEGQETEFENLSNLFVYIDNHMINTLEELRNPSDVPCIIPPNPAIRRAQERLRIEYERNQRDERERLETLRLRQERLNTRQREIVQFDMFAGASSKRSKKDQGKK